MDFVLIDFVKFWPNTNDNLFAPIGFSGGISLAAVDLFRFDLVWHMKSRCMIEIY